MIPRIRFFLFGLASLELESAGNCPYGNALRFFQAGTRFPRPGGDKSNGDEPKKRTESPLTRREKAIYLLLGIMGVLPLLYLAVLWVVMHSPLVAN